MLARRSVVQRREARQSRTFALDTVASPLGAHVLFYRHGSSEEVEVIRILHQRMDVSGNLDDG
jgi:plasmid stabilization system protein ParE